MAISNVNSYANAYESLYASGQTKTSETDKATKTSSTSQTTDEYLSYLRQKYSNVNIKVADFSSDKQLKSYMLGSSGYSNVAISSTILEKMASDPATAAKYEKVIADAPNLGEEFKKECAALGTELLACGTVIDKNGNVSYWGVGKGEAVENPGTVYKEKVQKQLEEKRANKKEEEAVKEKKQEKAAKLEKLQEKKVFMAESREELLEKIKSAKEDEPSARVRIKEEGKGGQIDLSV